MNHLKESTKPIHWEEATEEQLLKASELYIKHFQRYSFDECYCFVCANDDIDCNRVKFEKLSNERVKLLKKGEKHVVTVH